MNGGLLLLYEKEDKIQMIERLDDTRINELTEAIIIDYLKTKGQVPESIVCVDIEGLASSVLTLFMIILLRIIQTELLFVQMVLNQ